MNYQQFLLSNALGLRYRETGDVEPAGASSGAITPEPQKVDALGLTTADRQKKLDRTVGIGAVIVGLIGGFVAGKLSK